MPMFTYTPLTATSYRVSDAHTREEYGTVYVHGPGYCTVGPWAYYPTREEAAQALYRTRTAFGFEAGAL